MALADLLEQVPQPAEAQLEVKCRHCLHFETIAYYKIGGRHKLCSDEAIGRRSNDTPCPHFAVNMHVLRTLQPETIAQLLKLLVLFGLENDGDKTKVRQRADLEALLTLSLTLRALYNARRSGFELAGEYAIPNHPTGDTGTLLTLGRTHGVVQAKGGGVCYTVERGQLVRVQR